MMANSFTRICETFIIIIWFTRFENKNTNSGTNSAVKKIYPTITTNIVVNLHCVIKIKWKELKCLNLEQHK